MLISHAFELSVRARELISPHGDGFNSTLHSAPAACCKDWDSCRGLHPSCHGRDFGTVILTLSGVSEWTHDPAGGCETDCADRVSVYLGRMVGPQYRGLDSHVVSEMVTVTASDW